MPNDTLPDQCTGDPSPKSPSFKANDDITGDNADRVANQTGEEPTQNDLTNPQLPDDTSELPADEGSSIISEEPQEHPPSSELPPPVEGPNIPQIGLLKYFSNFGLIDLLLVGVHLSILCKFFSFFNFSFLT